MRSKCVCHIHPVAVRVCTCGGFAKTPGEGCKGCKVDLNQQVYQWCVWPIDHAELVMVLSLAGEMCLGAEQNTCRRREAAEKPKESVASVKPRHATTWSGA